MAMIDFGALWPALAFSGLVALAAGAATGWWIWMLTSRQGEQLRGDSGRERERL